LAIDGLTSFASAWHTRRRQDRATRLEQFVDEASEPYADALVHDQAEITALVGIYAL
jgi:hypothetical protein